MWWGNCVVGESERQRVQRWETVHEQRPLQRLWRVHRDRHPGVFHLMFITFCRFASILLALLAAGCATSFQPNDIGERCDLPDGGFAECPEGAYCARLTSTGERTCRLLCEGISGSRRCETGEACLQTYEPPPAADPPTCWPGRDVTEGSVCTTDFDCARGLWCAQDYGTEEGGFQGIASCQPVCNSDADCTRTGERCISNVYCAAPCNPVDPSTCPDGAVCRNSYCEWAPRAADCDRDGTPDCPLGQICLVLEAPECFQPIDYVGW